MPNVPKPEPTLLDQILEFNKMYGLNTKLNPTFVGVERLRQFKDILLEEVAEVDDIIQKNSDDLDPLDLVTEVADWLGDLIVYAASECARWGINVDEVLKIIMASNASKLGADGNPIYDDRGKVLKGPNYWKPEDKIRECLKITSLK